MCVAGTKMPKMSTLPTSIRGLAQIQALDFVADRTFDADFQQLLEAIVDHVFTDLQ